MSELSCPFCDGPNAPAAGGPCQGCLDRFIDYESRRCFAGAYELLGEIGEGGTALVHLAQHRVSAEMVAIKFAKQALLDVPSGAELFLRQARIEKSLRHTNILKVDYVGEHAGRPFFVMPLMEGTLVQPEHLERLDTLAKRLELMLKVTRAVQFAHSNGVLHCDLKPENILVDEHDEPHVSDFGLARAVGAADAEGFHGGTPGWMSPEQVRRRPLTTASDVFVLGLLIHWLTSGEHAFGTGDDFERRVLWAAAPRLPRYRPGLEWGLLAIAHKALQLSPANRYQTAAGLARDLERLRDHETLLGPRLPFDARVWNWTERHPGARVALLVLLPCFTAATMIAAQAQEDALRESVQDMNDYAASGQASTVLYQLREYAEVLQRAAADPAVAALVSEARTGPAGKNPCLVQNELADPSVLRPYAEGFSTLGVHDAAGCARARVAEDASPIDFIKRRFDLRDYFEGARRDAERCEQVPRVRKAYRSSISQLIKFAVSVPLLERNADGGCRFLGVLSGSVLVASTLDLPRTRRASDRDRVTAVLGPFEGEPPYPSQARPTEFTYLAHAGLERGQKVMLDSRHTLRLALEFPESEPPATQFALRALPPYRVDKYEDPLWGDHWLGAFAAVGGTGYVVLVQTRDSVATRPARIVWRLGYALLFVSLTLLLGWGSFFTWKRVVERRWRARPRKEAPPVLELHPAPALGS
ncbi:MAG TPA: serine/threonine-protein kinase [Polyangiaceae bacterium]